MYTIYKTSKDKNYTSNLTQIAKAIESTYFTSGQFSQDFDLLETDNDKINNKEHGNYTLQVSETIDNTIYFAILTRDENTDTIYKKIADIIDKEKFFTLKMGFYAPQIKR
jgi:hypothetical protein